MNKLMVLFGSKLWFTIFISSIIVFGLMIVAFGWDVGIPFSTFRYGKFIDRTLHFRSVILFLSLAALCIYKYGTIFNGFIPFYLTFITVFGCYGLSELLVDVIHIQVGFETPLSLLKDLFYWCQYLMQLVILRMFSTEPLLSKFSNGVWDNRGKKYVVVFLIVSVSIFIIAQLHNFDAMFPFKIPDIIVNYRYLLGFFFKLFMVLSFGSYVNFWKVVK